MKLTIYTDGGSLNNPGQAAIGYLLYDGSTCLHRASQAIGIASNNVAEYTALITALETTAQMRESGQIPTLTAIEVYADSELMVKQLNGVYKIKNPDIKQCMTRLQSAIKQLNVPISFTHVLREKNKEADQLVKQALGR